MSAAYTLAWTGLLLPGGKLGDRYGRKLVLGIGLVVFGAASVVASQMDTATGLIWTRAAMGVGAALIIPLTLSILPALFTAAERPRAVAVVTSATMLGLPLGPLVAGYLLDHFDWGWVFLINLPVVALSLLGLVLLVPESKDGSRGRLDWPGAVLASGGLIAVVFAIIERPDHVWSDPWVWGSLVGGVIALLLFVLVETRTAAPMVDLRLFLNRRFTWATVAFTVVSFAISGVLFVLTPFMQIIQHQDAMSVGFRLLPMIGATIVGAVVSDGLGSRFGAKVIVTIGLLVTGAGVLVMSTVGASSGYGIVALALVIFGLGQGLTMPAAVDSILGALPAGQEGVGNGLSRTIQSIGVSFGAAVLGSVLNSAYQSGVTTPAGLPPQASEAIHDSVAGAAAVAQRLPDPSTLLNSAFGAYADGMHEVLLITGALMAVGAVLVFSLLPGRAPSTDEPVDADRELAQRVSKSVS